METISQVTALGLPEEGAGLTLTDWDFANAWFVDCEKFPMFFGGQ